MTETHEFTTESQARDFWHHLSDQMSFERFVSQCSCCLKAGVYMVTIDRSADIESAQ